MRWWMFTPCMTTWPTGKAHAPHDHVCMRDAGSPHVCTCARCDDPTLTIGPVSGLRRVGGSGGGHFGTRAAR